MPQDQSETNLVNRACPLPITDHDHIVLAHGGGGKLTAQLLERVFFPAFKNAILEKCHDGAVFPVGSTRLAFSTDSYVIRPLVFPGGDIGALAVNGTVNDLAMCGARPLYLSAAFIMEEGLPTALLAQIVQSMQAAALAASVQIVTGDTKVVDKGKGDGMFINTAGIGILEHNQVIDPSQVKPGDAVLINGDIGRHGMAIMAVREGLAFETTIQSDCAPLAQIVLSLLAGGVRVHCLRDLTRGGLATTLVEIAETAGVEIVLQENQIQVTEEVRGACELLGFDPLYVANEGRFIAVVDPADVDLALRIMRAGSPGKDAAIIGTIKPSSVPQVILQSAWGTQRMVDRLSGEQLPRIC
jgi:hydrogenase expression/formation protein HypE